jgi:type IV pilus assembly protein PilV
MLVTNPNRVLKSQRGSALLEGLIAILIFSMGILAIIGLQAASIKTVSDSQYRLQASFLANRIIAEMWTNTANINTFQYPGGGATALGAWITEVNSALPGATDLPPSITIAGDATNGYQATVQLNWKAAGESSAHNFRSIAYINPN